MFIEKSKIVVQAHKFLDIFMTAMAFIGAYFIKNTFFRSLFVVSQKLQIIYSSPYDHYKMSNRSMHIPVEEA